MYEYYRKILIIGFNMLNYIGLNPLEKQTKRLLMFIVCVAILSYLVILSFIYDDLDIVRKVDLIKTALQVIRVINDITVITIHRKAIRNFVKDMHRYWPIPHNDENFQRDCSRLLTYIRRSLLAWITYVVIVIPTILIVSLRQQQLFMMCYAPTNIMPLNIIIVINTFSLLLLVICVVGTDSIVLAMISLLAMQFKILNHRIVNIKFDYGQLTALDICVHQHKFLLWQCKNLNKIWSLKILSQIGLAFGLICMPLYVSIEGDIGLGSAVINFSLFLGVSLELLLFYSLPAEFLNSQAMGFNRSIYFTNWYDAPHSVKKSLLIMMTKGQAEIGIFAGGVVPVNFTTFVSVFKTALSYFTILRQLKSN